jgi:glycine cleavage system pyridoxal-binding protein P
MSTTLEVHNTRYNLTYSNVELILAKVPENIQQSDALSNVEKAQFLDWFNERYENLSEVVGNAKQFADAISEGLSGVITPESIEIIIKIIKSI